MSYETFGNGSLKQGTCPICAGQKNPLKKFCTLDCYSIAPMKEKSPKTLEIGQKGMFSVSIHTYKDYSDGEIPLRDFKIISPSNKKKVWNEKTNFWELPTEDLEES